MESLSGGNPLMLTQSTQGAEESNTCIICSETWKRTGTHCVVSLACGHLFGKKCIERWIQDRGRKYGAKGINCPMCMKTARLIDLRNVIPSRIAAKDTAISDKLKVELERKKVQVKEGERLLDNSRLALVVLKNHITSRKNDKCRLSKLVSAPSSSSPSSSFSSSSSSSSSTPLNQQPNTQIPSSSTIVITEMEKIPIQIQEKTNESRVNRFTIHFSHRLSENRNVARVMASNKSAKLSYISFKSAESNYGVLELDPQDPKNTNYMPIHTSLIKDVKYNDTNIIMTTSLDKSLKFTSTTSNTITDSISLPLPGWSCCFNPTKEFEVICGLADSQVLIYDRRNTKSFLKKHCSPSVSKTPMHSLFVKSINNEQTIYCSNLNQTFVWNASSICKLWEFEGCTDYNPYSLSNHNGNDQENYILLSSRNKTSTKHQVIDINPKHENPLIVSTVNSAASQKGLAKTYSYTPPYDTMYGPITCYSDEALGTLNLSRSRYMFQHFNIQSCPLDICLFNDEKLAFLTDNRFFLLKPLYYAD